MKEAEFNNLQINKSYFYFSNNSNNSIELRKVDDGYIIVEWKDSYGAGFSETEEPVVKIKPDKAGLITKALQEKGIKLDTFNDSLVNNLNSLNKNLDERFYYEEEHDSTPDMEKLYAEAIEKTCSDYGIYDSKVFKKNYELDTEDFITCVSYFDASDYSAKKYDFAGNLIGEDYLSGIHKDYADIDECSFDWKI